MVHNPPNLKIGDLVVKRATKKCYIVLDVKPYRRHAYGAKRTHSRRRILVVSPTGKQTWKVDTALKVEFYLPGDSWFEDIR
mgnify:FL=1